MKRFNFFYYNTSITKSEFNKKVPKNWQDNLNEYNEYSYGGFKAILIS
jgi:hypothetical protein